MGIRWDTLKSKWLKRKRGFSFEEILHHTFVAVAEHPKKLHQKLMLFELSGYIWVVPYVKKGNDIFLKTAFPSRAYTKRWIQGEFK